MRDDICTIPISEVFEQTDGCPICRMRDTVEGRILDYIMGAAMMEPDVREATNKTGFCSEHLNQMMDRRGRLSLALMLETHLAEILDTHLTKKGLLDKKPSKKIDKTTEMQENCFICSKIGWGMERMVEMVYRMYEEEADFRRQFDAQPMFCLPHYTLLMQGADKKLMKNRYSDFEKSLTSITAGYLQTLCADMRHYCSMYDYRNAGKEDADWGNARDAVERAVEFLSARYPKKA